MYEKKQNYLLRTFIQVNRRRRLCSFMGCLLSHNTYNGKATISNKTSDYYAVGNKFWYLLYIFVVQRDASDIVYSKDVFKAFVLQGRVG